MRNPRLLAIGALLMPALSVSLLAQTPQQGRAQLPIQRVVLFSSGVGYFQREGTVDGNTRIDLQFPTQNINDLLKSLVLQDAGGGKISTVNYDSRDPIEKTLKSFAIDLTSNPSLGQLLGQVRGERVEVLLLASSTPTAGIIVGVEKKSMPIGKDQFRDSEVLNLLTDQGLKSIPLDSVQSIKFLRAELEQEFRQALTVLATAHDKQKKSVSLNFQGNGRRPVRVGYVTESPIWKTSYRLSLEKDAKSKAFLQGWAIVENSTDEDWNNVSLGLIAGRPISFQMDLYQPLYVPRPVVEPELFASLRPQTYSGNLYADTWGQAEAKERQIQIQGGGRGGRSSGAAGFGAGGPGGPGAAPMGGTTLGREALRAAKPESDSKLNFQEGVASAAIATELGEYFQYQLEHPVSLPRQKSALLPIVNQAVEASKVSIYNDTVHAKYPLLGLSFKNTTGLHLMQGPLTIFEGNSYAGDARVGDLQPNETRLVSYAVDLGTEVVPEYKNPTEDLVSVKIYKGILNTSYKQRQTKTYTIKNRSEHARTVLVEHPYRADWKLTSTDKPKEKARDVYRFEIKVEPGKSAVEEVSEEHTRFSQFALTNSDDESIRVFLRASAVSGAVKAALQEALTRKAKLAEVRHQIQQENQKLGEIEKDQARMRANMERVPQTSEAYKRYLAKFDSQETEIEKLRERVVKLQEVAEAERKSYENYLLTLSVE